MTTNRVKPVVKRSLIIAQAAAAAAQDESFHASRQSAEQAVLVAVEFTGHRRKPTSAASLARKAAAVTTGAVDLDIHLEESAVPQPKTEPDHTGLDFEASLAEFEELARSAG